MAEQKATRKPYDWRAAGQRLRKLSVEFIKRTYAMSVILITAWLSYRALRYLVVTLMLPGAAPEQIVGVPRRLDQATLATKPQEWLGVQVSEHPRIPPSRYHQITGWILPDRHNDCTQSGCHVAFPHDRRPELRAFLNMHATSIHCSVCHLETPAAPPPLTWYSLRDGERREPPSVLTAYGWLASAATQGEPTAQIQKRLVAYLEAAAREAEGARRLRWLAKHLAAVRYSSAEYQRLQNLTLEALPNHFRGVYGAKLTLDDTRSGEPLRGTPGTKDAVERYLREADAAGPEQRAALLAAVHPRRRTTPLDCSACHIEQGGFIDWDSAGYPAARVAMLRNPIIFRMIENIAAGQPFYLPGFMTPADPVNEPAPATP